MKLILFLLISSYLSLITNSVKGQVIIETNAIKVAVNSYEIRISVAIEDSWHIYSINTPANGPLATRVTFKKNPIVSAVGSLKEEGDIIEKHEEVFNSQVMFYEKKVVFIQKVIVKGKSKTNVVGTIEYMLCNEEQCMPPKKETFNVTIK